MNTILKHHTTERCKSYEIVIISRYSPFKRKGGLENVVYEQIVATLQKGLKTIVIFRTQGRERNTINTVNNIKLITISDMFNFLPDALKDIIYALPMYFRLINTCPKIVIDNFEFTLLAKIIFKLKKRNPVLIKVHHGTPAYLNFYTGMKGALAKIYKIIMDFLMYISLKHIDLNIAVSNKVKAELMKYYGVPSNKIIVIPNGVDTNKFKPRSKVIARKLLNLPYDKKIILFVGSDIHRKDFLTALKVVNNVRREVPNILFLVVTSEKYKKYLEKLKIEWLKIFTNVPSNIMPYLYNAADIFILPSKYEGCPLSLLEALASGCPAVVSTNVAEEEYNYEGYLIAHNFDEFVEFCKKLLVDPRYLSEMSLKARRLAISRYNIKNQRRLYIKIISTLLELRSQHDS